MREELVKRFLKYVSVDTMSDEDSESCPSSKGQLELGKILVEELKELGLEEVDIDENGYVMASLLGNTDKKVPVIGFIAHMDSSPDMSGKDIKPIIVENYDGGDIVLNKDLNITLSPKDFPEIKSYIGNTLITTDGTTLLGADDKAGIAEIITAVNYLKNHPEIKHGDIKVCFTPDEEIGRGADKFNVEKFACDYAYTMDGGHIGELEYESFNAAAAKITIKGTNVHPGYAKGKMVSSLPIAMELASMLPAKEVPEETEGYEGFYHLLSINGNVENTKMYYIIRDFDRASFENRKTTLSNVVKTLQDKYGTERIVLDLKDQYYNMREKIEPVKEVFDTAYKALENCGIKPIVQPIRGGTDGARLSFMGLPTPNIFAGGENFHGKFEYLPVESMEKAAEVVVEIARLYGEK